MQKTLLYVALLILALAAGSLYFSTQQQKEPSNAEVFLNDIYSSNRYLTTDEIAKRIIEDDPSLYLVDVRAEWEFSEYSLPESVNIPLENVLNEEWKESLDQNVLDVVFISNDAIIAEQAWAFCKQQGYSNLYVMDGGLNHWFATIMLPKEPGELASSEEMDLYSFRTGASIYFGSGTVEIPVIVEVEEQPEPVKKKTIPVKKKVKAEAEGGC